MIAGIGITLRMIGNQMPTIKLQHSQWNKIKNLLQQEHPRTVFMLRERMKKVLGFVPRDHRGYRMRTAKEIAEYDMSDHMFYDNEIDRRFHRLHKHEQMVCLDFYNERKYTMFLLKFSELLNGDNNDIR
jgi:hypothetical protein